ncbi:hypothetical protein [Geopseudomonas aromaticivorans]
MSDDATQAMACEYQRGSMLCRGDGFLWDADADGYDPEEQDYPCPACNTAEYLLRAKEEAESTSEWMDMGDRGTGEDIWLGALRWATEVNPAATAEALAEIRVVEALVPDKSNADGCAVRRHIVG